MEKYTTKAAEKFPFQYFPEQFRCVFESYNIAFYFLQKTKMFD